MESRGVEGCVDLVGRIGTSIHPYILIFGRRSELKCTYILVQMIFCESSRSAMESHYLVVAEENTIHGAGTTGSAFPLVPERRLLIEGHHSIGGNQKTMFPQQVKHPPGFLTGARRCPAPPGFRGRGIYTTATFPANSELKYGEDPLLQYE